MLKSAILSSLSKMGLKIDVIKLMSLQPLLAKPVKDFDADDVATIALAVGIKNPAQEAVDAVLLALHDSNLTKVAELIQDEEVLVPIVKKLAYSDQHILDKLRETESRVPVQCDGCMEISYVDKFSIEDLDDKTLVSCRFCSDSKLVSNRNIIEFGA